MNMLTRVLALALLVVLMTVGARAQTMTATLSGAVGKENRFLLDVAPPNGWEVKQFAELIEVRFPGLNAEISLPTAIRPPIGDLSTEVRNGDTYLRFTVMCACSLSIVSSADSGLILDFVEEAVVAAGPAPMRAPMPPVRARGTGDVEGPGKPERAEDVDVAQARKQLMKQLLRAAEAGLIELDGEIAVAAGGAATTGADAGGETPEPGTDDAGNAKLAANEATVPRPDETAVNDKPTPADDVTAPDIPGVRPDGRRTSTGASDATRPQARCHRAEVFELPWLGSADEWVKDVGELRSGLLGEFDRPEQSAVLDLARAYLAAGFGEEASAVLSDLSDGGADAAVLAEVAVVVAGRPLSGDSSVLLADCLGPQALWRALALAEAGDAEGAMTSEQAAGRALEKLPPGLRKEAAARLGLAAADAGQWDAARRLASMVRRSDADPTGKSGLAHILTARLADWAEDDAAAIQALTLARAGDPDVAAEATMVLAEKLLKSDLPAWRGINQLITDLGLLARLHRGVDTGARAATLEVRLTDLTLGRSRAIDLLTLGLAQGDFTEETFTGTLSAMVEGGDEAAKDSIASIYLEDRQVFGPALVDPKFRAVLARSLIKLGLPAQAADLYGDGSVPGDVAVALAEGFLDVGENRAAIAVIADLPDSPLRNRLYRAATGAVEDRSPGSRMADDAGRISTDRLVVMARAAIAAGDLPRALDLTMERLKRAKDKETAETAAMIALALGRTGIPEEAAAVLKADDPALHDRLTGLFTRPSAAMDPKDPTTAAAFLKRLDAEIAIIEGVLEDG